MSYANDKVKQGLFQLSRGCNSKIYDLHSLTRVSADRMCLLQARFRTIQKGLNENPLPYWEDVQAN